MLARFSYPAMCAARNFAFKLKGVSKMNNLVDKEKPIFQLIFGDGWSKLPPVMLKHYANRPYSNDISTVEGHLDVMCKWYIQPLFCLLGTVPAYNEKNVSVTVNFTSQQNNSGFGFERVFYFKNRKPFHFRSCMYQVSGNEVMERMKYGICWHSSYSWDGKQVVLAHKGYSLRIFGINIPLPITWLIGRGDAYEIPIDDNTFGMCVNITHPLLGNIYEYKGQFKIIKEI